MKKKAKVLLSILMTVFIFLTMFLTRNIKVYAFLADNFVVGNVQCDTR